MLLLEIEEEKKRQKQFWDDSFEQNQAALTAHRAMIASVSEPSPETLAINKVLEPLGFSHGGDFYPGDFDYDSYKWVEIGCSAIAYTDTWIGVLNYSIMEYWEADHNNSGLVELTEKAVKELEKVDG